MYMQRHRWGRPLPATAPPSPRYPSLVRPPRPQSASNNSSTPWPLKLFFPSLPTLSQIRETSISLSSINVSRAATRRRCWGLLDLPSVGRACIRAPLLWSSHALKMLEERFVQEGGRKAVVLPSACTGLTERAASPLRCSRPRGIVEGRPSPLGPLQGWHSSCALCADPPP